MAIVVGSFVYIMIKAHWFSSGHVRMGSADARFFSQRRRDGRWERVGPFLSVGSSGPGCASFSNLFASGSSSLFSLCQRLLTLFRPPFPPCMDYLGSINY